ncbi:hypothetical protein BJ508DRAFT_365116, partial [Ascobolus immersus RN42]
MFSRLPAELLYIIFGFLQDNSTHDCHFHSFPRHATETATLHALSLVDRATNQAVTPLLYRRVLPKAETVHLLVRTILEKPELGEQIHEAGLHELLLSSTDAATNFKRTYQFRTLWDCSPEIDLDPEQASILEHVHRKLRDNPTQQGTSFSPPLQGHWVRSSPLATPWMWAMILLFLTPNLKGLDLTTLNVDLEILFTAPRISIGLLSSLTTLQRSGCCHSQNGKGWVDGSRFIHEALSLQALHHLHVFRHFFTANELHLRDAAQLDLSGISNLQSLKLEHCQIDRWALLAILKRCHRLRMLDIATSNARYCI